MDALLRALQSRSTPSHPGPQPGTALTPTTASVARQVNRHPRSRCGGAEFQLREVVEQAVHFLGLPSSLHLQIHPSPSPVGRYVVEKNVSSYCTGRAFPRRLIPDVRNSWPIHLVPQVEVHDGSILRAPLDRERLAVRILAPLRDLELFARDPGSLERLIDLAVIARVDPPGDIMSIVLGVDWPCSRDQKQENVRARAAE